MNKQTGLKKISVYSRKGSSIRIGLIDLLSLDPEALAQVVIDRVSNFYLSDKKNAFADWLHSLTNEQLVALFAIGNKEPKPKPVVKTPDQKRGTVRNASSSKPWAPKPKPRAKRSKTKAEVADLRKSKRRDKATPAARPAKPPVGADKEEPLISPGAQLRKQERLARRPPIATGEQLAGDESTREHVLAFIRGSSNGCRAKDIEEDCELTPGQTKGLLKRLREQGAIRVDGKNRGAKYSAIVSNGAAAHP